MLRQSLLVNGILTNSEVWYGLNQSEIQKLESVDKSFLRQTFRVSVSGPSEALYLETGLLPLGIIIKANITNNR